MMAATAWDGEWLNTAQENMDGFLKAVGLGWAKRKLASAVSYGVGSHKLLLGVNGDRVKVTTIGQQTTENEFVLGGGAQTVNSADGPVEAIATWGETHDAFEVRTVMYGRDVTVVRRLVDAKTLVMTLQVGDTVATRTFVKK